MSNVPAPFRAATVPGYLACHRYGRRLRQGMAILSLALPLLLSGCASLLVPPLVTPLQQSLERQSDLDLLRDGTPSLLLIMDGLLTASPDDRRLQVAAARAYSSYAALLAEYNRRDDARRYAEKGKELSLALLGRLPGLADIATLPVDQCRQAVARTSRQDLPTLFWGGWGWATWIRLQEGAPAAMIALPKVQLLMERVVALDDTYYYGSAHLFLGVLLGTKPPLFGGRPEESRAHFERALAIAHRRFLATQVAYAETYARQVFNRDLFASLLKEVLDQPLTATPNLTAANRLAKLRAERLLRHIDDYF